MGKSNKGFRETPSTIARRNWLGAQSFQPLAHVVKAHEEELSTLVAEVDAEGDILNTATLEVAAILVMSGQFHAKKGAIQGTLQARWSAHNSDLLRKLNPNAPFQVAVAKPNKANAAKASAAKEILDISGDIGGLTLTPNDKGEHLVVPCLAALVARDTVLLVRDGEEVGTTSLINALMGGSVKDRARWAQPTKAEAAARAKAEAKAKAEADAKAIADAEAKAKADARDSYIGALMDLDVLMDAELEERAEKEKRERFATLLRSNPGLRQGYESVRDEVNTALAEDADLNAALIALVRMTPPPAPEALRLVLYRAESQGVRKPLISWLQEKYEQLMELTLGARLEELDDLFGDILTPWFVAREGIAELELLEPLPQTAELSLPVLRGILDRYPLREAQASSLQDIVKEANGEN